MAPHDTNIERQARRHRGPLIGMGVCVLLVLIGFLWWVGRSMQGRDEVNATEEPAAASVPADPATTPRSVP